MNAKMKELDPIEGGRAGSATPLGSANAFSGLCGSAMLLNIDIVPNYCKTNVLT